MTLKLVFIYYENHIQCATHGPDTKSDSGRLLQPMMHYRWLPYQTMKRAGSQSVPSSQPSIFEANITLISRIIDGARLRMMNRPCAYVTCTGPDYNYYITVVRCILKRIPAVIVLTKFCHPSEREGGRKKKNTSHGTFSKHVSIIQVSVTEFISSFIIDNALKQITGSELSGV